MDISSVYDRLSKFGHGRYKYFVLGEGIDEIPVDLPAGGCYGKKRKYWAFGGDFAKLEKKLKDCPSVGSYKIYDLRSSVLNTQTNISFYYPLGVDNNQENYQERVKFELSSERMQEIINSKDNVKL